MKNPPPKLISASAVRFTPTLHKAASKRASEQGLCFSEYIREVVLQDVLETYTKDKAAQDAA